MNPYYLQQYYANYGAGLMAAGAARPTCKSAFAKKRKLTSLQAYRKASAMVKSGKADNQTDALKIIKQKYDVVKCVNRRKPAKKAAKKPTKEGGRYPSCPKNIVDKPRISIGSASKKAAKMMKNGEAKTKKAAFAKIKKKYQIVSCKKSTKGGAWGQVSGYSGGFYGRT